MIRNMPGTAHHPVKLVGCSHSPRLSSNWAMNESGSDYTLYFNTGFEGIPVLGDRLGIVAHVVSLARLSNSGVTRISVRSHEITLGTSDAVTLKEANELLQKAVLRAGLGIQVARS